ncbi:MAG: PilT/PilU family type 4a pilus ATPase [Deltaproteobacteria bacterium]|nr:PilT/PilU family type 4a pilus ATPase [Deltaproteobacteria bacterium]
MRKRLGEILIDAGLITNQDLNYALKSQRQLGGTVGEALVRLGYVSEEQILHALSKQLSLSHVNLNKISIPEDVLKVVSYSTVKERKILPLGYEGSKLIVGMVDPTDLEVLSQVEFKTGKATQPVIISSHQFGDTLLFFEDRGYGTVPFELREDVVKRTEVIGDDVDSFLSTLVELKGQDLHLSAGAIPSLRVDNELRRLNFPALTPNQMENMMSKMLSSERKKRFDETFELDFAHSLDGVGRFRCNLYKQRGSLAFIARHVVEDVPEADELGLPSFIRDYALKISGLILIVGANGHGKSTTLATMVDLINRERKANIITIEDPIEFTHKHKNSNVNQREVGTDTKSFADGLRHIFRQNPDVIVIGELRDFESISIALSAAETGHLVMGTLHSNNAVSAVDRIIDIFPPSQQQQVRAQFADCIELVFSQRLIKKADGTGRILAWEKMATSPRVRNAIREGKTHNIRNMMQTNLEELVSIDWTIAELVAAGRVHYEEAIKFADNLNYFNDLLKLRGVYR